jgi:hypothetical protein
VEAALTAMRSDVLCSYSFYCLRYDAVMKENSVLFVNRTGSRKQHESEKKQQRSLQRCKETLKQSVVNDCLTEQQTGAVETAVFST